MLIGHEKIWNFFENALKSGNLSHAYCFSGLEALGKKTLARKLAARLLNVEEPDLEKNPDYYYMERACDEKTGKLKKDISINQVREMKRRLQGRAISGGYQVAVINEAELLRRASNSLLKLLEEPVEKSIIILLTTNVKAILPTIRSRCQVVQFWPVEQEQIKKYLDDEASDNSQKENICRASWERPGRAVDMVENPEELVDYLEEEKRLVGLLSQPFHRKLQMTDDLFGDKTDAMRDRGRIQHVLDLWMMVWRARLKNGEVTPEKASDIVDCLFQSKRLLGENVHPRLIIEQLLLKF